MFRELHWKRGTRCGNVASRVIVIILASIVILRTGLEWSAYIYCRATRSPAVSSKSLCKNSLIVTVAALVMFGPYFLRRALLSPKDLAEQSKSATEIKEKQVREGENRHIAQLSNPARQVSIVRRSWGKRGLGTVMLANLTIENDNDFRVKDITIRCVLRANIGTTLNQVEKTILRAFQLTAEGHSQTSTWV
jgi:hypothetical protein